MRKKAKKSVLTWRSLPLSKVVEVNPRETLPPKDLDDMDVPFYEMAAIDEFAGRLREPTMVPLGKCRSGRTKFRNGDVLFAKITPCVQNGKSALVNGIKGDLGFGSSEFYVLRPSAKILSEYLFYFVRQRRVVQAAVDSFSGTSGRQRVPSAFWESLEIPIPPLPVQERIIEILRRADEIRHKRQEALDLTDKILPSLFIEMFGDPATNPKGWPEKTLDDCAFIKRGLSKRPSPKGTTPIVRIKNLTLSGLDLSWHENVEVSSAEVERGQLQTGDIVFAPLNGSIEHLAKSDVFIEQEGQTWVLDSNLCAFRAKDSVVNPGFLATFLSLPSTLDLLRNHYAVRTSGGQWLLKSSTLRTIKVPIPPLSQQEYFVKQASQYSEVRSKYIAAKKDAENSFRSLLSHAFTGKLTAEWEKANAEWIAEQVEFHKQLPRLILLAFLRERANRAGRKAKEAAILVTAMMKYAFLLQMEGNGRRRLYQFVPYHYGPFAKDLYADIEKLQEDGLVTVDNDTDEDKTRIILADSTKADDALAVLPDDLKEDISAILNTYGDLDHNALLKTVYEKYPVYAKKSRIRKARKASSAGKKRGRRPRK